VFHTTNNEMITCGPIDFYSLCPHHLAPVFGKAWIGYIPDGKCLGLSKIPRLVRWMAGSPIKQEDLTAEIATKFEEILFPCQSGPNHAHEAEPDICRPRIRNNGVAVVLQGTHLCMLVRGVKVNSNCTVQTSKMTGC